MDSDLSMQSHKQRTVAGCFSALRQIRSVRWSLPPTMLETLVVSLVLIWLDYGNATLAGIPANLFASSSGRAECFSQDNHWSTTLGTHHHVALHWLRTTEHIKFKFATSTYCCLHCAAPHYLSAQLTRVADMPSRRRLRSSATGALLNRPTRLIIVGDRAFSVVAAKL
jgi:hypothetical protein